MNSKVARGKDRQLTGSIEEALGKLTGIDELEEKGARDKSIGQVEEALGRKQASATKQGKKSKTK